ncbi:MAG: protease inhibitor I42 family protein [Actinobacteria bacterium]|nr:protease inhibitor I42 family protein [Actinomycetota bacterium]
MRPSRRRSWAPALTVLFVVVGCTGTGDTTAPARTVFSPRDGDTIAVTVGQPFTIRLPADPSTGFAWSVDGPSDDVLLLDSTFVPLDAPRPATAVAQLLRFQVNKVGAHDLALAYERPFPEGDPPTRVFAIDARG